MLLGKQDFDTAGKFRWRLQGFVEFKNLGREFVHAAKVP